MKSHGDQVTDFYYNEILTVDSNHTCLSVISLDSAFNKSLLTFACDFYS